MVFLKLLLICILIKSTASLECFSCPSITDLNACNRTLACGDGEACYQNTSSSSQGQIFSLGCIANKRCDAHGNIPSTIVGRGVNKRQTTNCLECCSTDHCNKHLCEHLKPQACIDDESMDCARLNSLFSICNDISQAKKVCPKFCGLCNVVDGNWTPWSNWSHCDVTCENGVQTRTRSCTNPAPKYGGQNCIGNSTDVKVCMLELCPVHGGWSLWAEWGKCSVTCDMGLQSRSRDCSNPVPNRFGDHCFGQNRDTRLCMPMACSNGGWSDWELWSTCSVTCGGGVQSRYRSCTNPRPSPYGKYCQGTHSQTESCAGINCETKHCTSNPCANGQCYEVLHDYLCSCDDGYKGRNCNISSTHCQPNPCVHGSCMDLRNGYLCTCDQGYEGRNCNISNSLCKSSPCIHGKCFDSSDGFVCVCDDGYRGKQCNISIDHCLTKPCLRGNCVNGISNYTCSCPAGVTGRHCETVPASDCYDIKQMSLGYKNGIYGVKLWKSHTYLEVLCDLETADGGWTVFQHRFNGSVDFYRNHASYTIGFGNLTGEFWLGLHYISELSSKNKTELRIDVEAADGTKAFEEYTNFRLTDPDYKLQIDKGFGTAGDSTGLYYSVGRRFSTYDHDVDDDSNSNNAQRCKGGWWYWYSPCAYVNLNGEYVTPGSVDPSDGGLAGMIYNNFKGLESLKSSKMMIRRT
ncbi:neurogenic locus notch homolog protein 1-like [Mercenaria mercenaria]|uniref:neurogenic locus notch homolog protein 1-like n=1 Tax=Mercenaria mercenaria TaxID=6596 RepID=UPI00234E403C|nr:neurogenic locus notch homolog protein 1-like [Mercenaria mercenaria]